MKNTDEVLKELKKQFTGVNKIQLSAVDPEGFANSLKTSDYFELLHRKGLVPVDNRFDSLNKEPANSHAQKFVNEETLRSFKQKEQSNGVYKNNFCDLNDALSSLPDEQLERHHEQLLELVGYEKTLLNDNTLSHLSHRDALLADIKNLRGHLNGYDMNSTKGDVKAVPLSQEDRDEFLLEQALDDVERHYTSNHDESARAASSYSSSLMKGPK